MKQKLIVIVGPTAVGKSKAALLTAKSLNGEIVSADSMQVYKRFDIGTAKVEAQELAEVKHHMIDIVDAHQEFSVAQYRTEAIDIISKINEQGKIPLLVGGTGLYVRAVIDPYKFQSQPTDINFREELHQLASKKGELFLHNKLAVVDPEAADRIHPNDVRRVVRALEYYHVTGETITSSQYADQSDDDNKSKYELAMIGLTMDRSLLYERINLRVDQMIELGLVQEVESLLGQGISGESIPMQGIGYKQIVNYLNGEYSLQEAIRLIKRDTRRYAKRQLTWFKRDKRINWVDVNKHKNMSEIAQKIIGFSGRTLNITGE